MIPRTNPMCIKFILSIVSKVLSENGNGDKYLKSLVETGEITKEDESTVLALVQLKVAEQKLDKLLNRV